MGTKVDLGEHGIVDLGFDIAEIAPPSVNALRQVKPDNDRERAAAIMEKHKDKDFVQRILDPKSSPYISSEQDSRLKKGDVASHQMSWGQNAPDDVATEFYVYPEIVRDQGNLHWFKEGEPYGKYKNAGHYAEVTGERITFDNKEDAEWLSKNYKRLWDDESGNALSP